MNYSYVIASFQLIWFLQVRRAGLKSSPGRKWYLVHLPKPFEGVGDQTGQASLTETRTLELNLGRAGQRPDLSSACVTRAAIFSVLVRMSDKASVAAAMASGGLKPIPRLREAGPLTSSRHSAPVKGKEVTSAGARRCHCRAS